jgi:integrase
LSLTAGGKHPVGVFKRNDNFFIDYYAWGRRIREKVGPSKGEALRALSVRKAEVALGKFNLVPRASIPTFKAFADRYEELVSIHKKGRAGEHYIIQMLIRIFGKRRISDITAEDGERFKTTRSRQVKPATVNREMTVLKHMMAKALGWKLLATNPLRGVQSLTVPKRLERILELNEELRLLAACDRVRSKFLRPVVILALNTGMRRGELLSLQWSQVDFSCRKIRVLNAKTESGDRTIPVNSTAYAVLNCLKGNRKSELVFPSSRKEGKRILDLKKGFKKAVRLAKLQGNLRFHDLRHTFATRLVQAGVDIITVQHLLGHARISMTARYAHSPDTSRIAAVERLDRLFDTEPAPNRPPAAKTGTVGGCISRIRPVR